MTNRLPNDSVMPGVFRDRRLPDSSTDAATSAYPTVTGADVVQGLGLADRSGHPEVGMMVNRHGPDEARCTSCQQMPWEQPQETHPYEPMGAYTKGVHPSVDDPQRAPRNSDGTEVGESCVVVDDDPVAQERWERATARHRSYVRGEGPFPLPV